MNPKNIITFFCRMACVGLLCFPVFVFVGCTKKVIGEKGIPVSPSLKPLGSNGKAWKQSEFILSTFHALHRSADKADYRSILTKTKAAGINRVELTFISPEALEAGLEAAEEVGIKVIAQDTTVYGGIADKHPKIVKQKILDRVNDLKRFTMLDGYYVWDEPFEKDFDKVASVNKILNEADPTRLAFSVIFPSYGVYNWETGAYNWDDNSYTRYVTGYMNKVNPDIFSFDYYPYRTNVANVDLITNDIWRDFGYIRKLVLERNKSLWFYFQAVNLIADQQSIMNVERIKAQMYAALAYGVKGMSYFSTHGSLLNKVHEKTDQYDELTLVNKAVKNIGNVLLNKKAEKLYHTGNAITEQLRTAYFLDKLSDSEMIKSAPDDLIIGVFSGKNAKGKYILFSNKSHSATISGVVNLSAFKKITAYNKSSGTEKIIFKLSNKFHLHLLPGEGELYHLE